MGQSSPKACGCEVVLDGFAQKKTADILSRSWVEVINNVRARMTPPPHSSRDHNDDDYYDYRLLPLLLGYYYTVSVLLLYYTGVFYKNLTRFRFVNNTIVAPYLADRFQRDVFKSHVRIRNVHACAHTQTRRTPCTTN